MESLGYMIIFLIYNYFPWRKIMDYKYMNEIDKINTIINLKTTIKPEILCKGISIDLLNI